MAEREESELIAQRRAKLEALREAGVAFPNSFRRSSLAAVLHEQYGEMDGEALESRGIKASLAGRLMARRIMGKASFAHIQDMSGRMQLYAKRDHLAEGRYAEFKHYDIGDIVGVEGTLFKTRTGELTVLADELYLLTKSLRPLPEKFHGLTDQESRYRQRYVDLIMNEDVRRTFIIRSAAINCLRQFLSSRGFLEVETPMMQSIPGGAAARPFATHHNALDMPLYLRVAPELFLKRLVVGGFEKVFEINRNFRNEGLSTQHNPEFTMLEFYEAYADYTDLMSLTEEMLATLAREVLGESLVHYQGQVYEFDATYPRLSVFDAILQFNSGLSADDIRERGRAGRIAESLDIDVKPEFGLGKIQVEIFEKTVEDKLGQPTFITEFPAEVSPLARRSDRDPFVTDRFELFVAGRELANGFSELNDPEDQAERFKAQAAAKAAGDAEAMHYDADYLAALECGLPPTAGEGIGIDRLVMLLTDSPSIRDVLLFPHMRPRPAE